MKILQISLGDHQASQTKALARVASEFVQINWKAYPEGQELQNVVQGTAAKFSPDVTFMQLQKKVLSEKTIRSIPGIKVNWTGDVRDPIPEWYKEQAPLFDLTLFSNMTDVHKMRGEGFRADFLDIGFEERIFKALGPQEYPPTPTVFMGNNYKDRFPLSLLRLRMAAMVPDITIYGKWWGTRAHMNLMKAPTREATIYRGAAIGVNLSHFNYEQYSSDRIYRMMACGCFCLSHNYPGIEKAFTPGVHLDTWNTLKELQQKIDYYLKNPVKREMIADEGHKLVWQKHTWDARVTQLMKMLNVSPIRNQRS